MMPSFYHANDFLTTCAICQEPRKNGFHKQTDDDEVKPKKDLSQHQQHCLLEGEDLIIKLEQKPDDLHLVSNFVQRYKETLLPLKNNSINLRICDLSGTIYMGQKFMLEGWRELYLPKSTRMEILGTIECSDSMVSTSQWIILVAENGHIYSYTDEELHLIAYSLRHLVENGITHTNISYPYQHDVSDEESFQEDDEIKYIKKRKRDYVDKHTNEFDDFLNFVNS